tara:strand:- start:4535 stop:4678 length:144 start_codon:yes stop_codon:yes gene_type:complete
MSFKKESKASKKVTKILHDNISSKKKDVVERFLSILWRREVDFKLIK